MNKKNRFLAAIIIALMSVTMLVPGSVFAETDPSSAADASAATETPITLSESNTVVDGIQSMYFLRDTTKDDGSGIAREQDMDDIHVLVLTDEGDQWLTYGEDYIVSYENNTSVGTATMIIHGIDKYTGSVSKTFEITKMDQTIEPIFGSTTWTNNSNISVYVGKTITLKVQNYGGNTSGTNVGTISAKVNGKLAIGPSSQSGETTTFKITAKKAGTGIVKITASGNEMYKSRTASYAITVKKNPKTALKSSYVKLSKSSYTYNGSYKKPGITVKVKGKKLKKNRDYTVKYYSNKYPGTAKVVIKAKGSKYEGSVTKTFKINKASQNVSVNLSASQIYLNGEARFTVNASKGNTNAGKITYSSTNSRVADVYESVSGNAIVKGYSYGTAKIKVTAAATKNYKAASKYFTVKVISKKKDDSGKVTPVTSKKITAKMITISPKEFKYDGKNHYPIVTVKDGTKKLTYGTDYRYWITNEKGSKDKDSYANIRLWGVGNYYGEINYKYLIKK